jgi:thiamine monophosphate synthase
MSGRSTSSWSRASTPRSRSTSRSCSTPSSSPGACRPASWSASSSAGARSARSRGDERRGEPGTGPGGAGLYAIADARGPGCFERLPAAVAAMAAAGVRWIQLRLKARLRSAGPPSTSPLRVLRRALAGERCRALGSTTGSTSRRCFRRSRCGLHLGQPTCRRRRPTAGRHEVADRLLDPRRGQLAAAAADPAVDVVAVGPVFATREQGAARPGRRPRLRPPRPGGDRQAAGRDRRHRREQPGRGPGAGADSVAVLGAVCRGDVQAACGRLLAAVDAAGGRR